MLKTLRKKLAEIRRNPLNVWHYFVGNYRYGLYYCFYQKDEKGYMVEDEDGDFIFKRHPLMRQHIWEQIKWRIKIMDKQCYRQGSCKLCGCETTALQMANKSCDKPCYPPMMSRKLWRKFLQGDNIPINNKIWFIHPVTKELNYV